MLQQTTVVAVVPYFERFLKRFPTVQKLASAEESDVLRLWEGLGYYSRGRNLLRAAKQIVEMYEGRFPDNVETLRALPGIGRYTAGAIASFAFDQCEPIVEANTLRLYSRLLGMTDDPRSKEVQEKLWGYARNILPTRSPGRFNQALMELGATICKPRQPDCSQCPLNSVCRAFQEQKQDEIPVKATRPEVTELHEVSVAIRFKGKYLLRQRTPDERWAGLWDFVRFSLNDNSRSVSQSCRQLAPFILDRVYDETGFKVEIREELISIKHSVTRYRIHLTCLTAQVVTGKLNTHQSWKWISVSDLNEIPLSVTGRKFAKRLAEMS